ncbi:g9270 [Coccomyxa viridis]|uniref:G9270 protein n=1 Tax=Coccomyxa viridis TaxID=1274662 RepID=A0ABP1G6N6_9CHLO
MAQDDTAVSEVILTIVTRIAELTRTEGSVVVPKSRQGGRGLDVVPTDRIVEPTHETLSDSQLFDLTVSAIDDCYRRAWTKLHSRHKADRLASFADAQKEPLELTDTEVKDLKEFLTVHYTQTKKLRGQDIQYDEATCQITSIPRLLKLESGFALKPAVKQAARAAVPREKPACEPAIRKILRKMR